MPSALHPQGARLCEHSYGTLRRRSAVNLRDCGAHIYAIDPTTQPLCLVYAIDDGEPQLWLPTDPVPSVFLEIATNPTNWQLIAHNYDFEREILENVLIPRYGFPADPARSAALHAAPGAGQRLSGRARSARPGARLAVSQGSGRAQGDAGGLAPEGEAQAQGDHRPDLG